MEHGDKYSTFEMPRPKGVDSWVWHPRRITRGKKIVVSNEPEGTKGFQSLNPNVVISIFSFSILFLLRTRNSIKRLCPSIRPSVGPSVGPLVRGHRVEKWEHECF